MAVNRMWTPAGFQSQQPDQDELDDQQDSRGGMGTRESITRSRHNRIGEGRSWRNYSELVGTNLGYDWRQYDFNDISPHSRNTTRTKGSQGSQEQKDPLAREFDVAPKGSDIGKPTQTVVGTDIERRQGHHIYGTVVGEDGPVGEIGNRRRQIGVSYTNGRGFSAGGSLALGSGAPAIGAGPRAIGMAPETRGPRTGTGMAQGGILRARQGIANPEQGNTAAAMYDPSRGRKVIDV